MVSLVFFLQQKQEKKNDTMTKTFPFSFFVTLEVYF